MSNSIGLYYTLSIYFSHAGFVISCINNFLKCQLFRSPKDWHILKHNIMKFTFVIINSIFLKRIFKYWEADRFTVAGAYFQEFWVFCLKYRFYLWPQSSQFFSLRAHLTHFSKSICQITKFVSHSVGHSSTWKQNSLEERIVHFHPQVHTFPAVCMLCIWSQRILKINN